MVRQQGRRIDRPSSACKLDVEFSRATAMVAIPEGSLPAATRRPIGAKGVFAAVLGNGYEFFDFGVFAAYLGILGQTFFPADNTLVSDLASAATFGVGFFARPLGGALIGSYGDRAGRSLQ
jgi:hypothetical protein